MAVAEAVTGRTRRGADLLRPSLLAVSFGLLLLVGIAGASAAKPGLGPRGWAPGDLPWQPTSAVVTALLAAAYLSGAAGVALGLWHRPDRAWSWLPVVLLAVAGLATGPFGSADHTNYAAYGRIALQGGDPYVVQPIHWHGGLDPITSAVEPPWTLTPSIYGPFATLLQQLSAWLGGDSVRQVVWVWQVLIVLSWLVVRILLRRLVSDHQRVDLLWTANPLVFGVGVLGAHIDLIATALAVATVWLAVRSAGPGGSVLSGAVLGVAASTKVTFGVVGLAIVVAWWRLQRESAIARSLALVAGALATAVALHLYAGPHVFDQLGRARRSVSLATPWRPVLEVLGGHFSQGTLRSLIFVASAAVCLGLAILLWRLTRDLVTETVGAQALRGTFVLSAAYALGAPYSLPWYDELAWATLPAIGASALDAILLARLTVMALAYVPGRVVAMSARVGSFTLGFRKNIAPYAGLLAWAAVIGAARLVSRRQSAPRPRASGR